MKAIKKILLVLGSLAGFTALVLQFYNPFQAPAWRMERVVQNRRATVHLLNITKNSTGSGVVISESGTILTAFHVASPGDTIMAIFYDHKGKKQFQLARVGILDKRAQLAILFTRGGLPHPAVIGRTRSVREGDLLYTVGYPDNIFRPMVDPGIVAQRYFIPPKKVPGPRNSLLMNVHPVPGMSGSPVFNSRGELVGIFDAAIGHVAIGVPRYWGVVSPIDALPRIIRQWLISTGQPAPTFTR